MINLGHLIVISQHMGICVWQGWFLFVDECVKVWRLGNLLPMGNGMSNVDKWCGGRLVFVCSVIC